MLYTAVGHDGGVIKRFEASWGARGMPSDGGAGVGIIVQRARHRVRSLPPSLPPSLSAPLPLTRLDARLRCYLLPSEEEHTHTVPDRAGRASIKQIRLN